jgi:hypothetical protein
MKMPATGINEATKVRRLKKPSPDIYINNERGGAFH